MSGRSSSPSEAPGRACLEALDAAQLLAYGALREGRLVHASRALADRLGIADAQGEPPFLDFVDAADRARVAQALAARTAWAGFLARRADGSLFEAELSGTPGSFAGGAAMIFTLADVTGRRAAPGEFSYAALHDGLTGLPNRELFVQRLRHAVALAQRGGGKVAALVVELDSPAGWGGEAAESVLRAGCARMRAALRDSDTLAYLGEGRLGIVLAPLAERVRAGAPAVRIAAALAPTAENEGARRTRLRIGIAAFPDDAADAEQLLERAGAALGEAPAEGSEFLVFARPRPPEGERSGAIAWEARYAVGIEVIDGQHRHLLGLINRIGAELQAGLDFHRIVDSVKELVRYTEHHFATEERLMDEVGAAAERHRAEHRRLEEGLARFTLRLDAAGVRDATGFLQDWLFRHIEDVDRPFAALLRNRGVS